MSILTKSRNTYTIIRDAILNMENPFLQYELISRLSKEQNITDKSLIFQVLDELRDAGLVENFQHDIN